MLNIDAVLMSIAIKGSVRCADRRMAPVESTQRISKIISVSTIKLKVVSVMVSPAKTAKVLLKLIVGSVVIIS